jgi:hypothetical protein
VTPRAPFDVPRGEVALDGPDHVVEPLLGGQVLGDSAQRDHGGVRVAVDQAGQGGLSARVDPLGGGQRHDVGRRGDGLDQSVAYDDRGVVPEGDLLMVVLPFDMHESGASRDDEVGGRSRHHANVRRGGTAM